jgi:hypothetical protein
VPQRIENTTEIASHHVGQCDILQRSLIFSALSGFLAEVPVAAKSNAEHKSHYPFTGRHKSGFNAKEAV